MIFLSALILGLTGSIHCLGMCGPLQLIFPWNQLKNSNILSYHLGRVCMYVLIGILFFSFGKTMVLFNIQQYLSIISGALLIIMLSLKSIVFKPLNLFTNWLRNKVIASGNQKNRFLMGSINGLLPCGLLYTAAIINLNLHYLYEVIIFMFLFGLGTTPILISLVKFKPFFINKISINKWIHIATFTVGIMLIVRGLGLNIPYLSPFMDFTSNTISCH